MPLIITIRVVPSSGRSQCILDKRDALKCFLKSPPEKGKANHELIKLLAQALKIAPTSIEIIIGQTMRTKTIKIDADYTYEQLLERLGIEKQTSLF